MKSLNLNNWEILYLTSLLGSGCGPDYRTGELYDKVCKLTKELGVDWTRTISDESYETESFVGKADIVNGKY